MALTIAETSRIATALAGAGWYEAVVRVGDVTIAVGRLGAAPAVLPAVPVPPTTAVSAPTAPADLRAPVPVDTGASAIPETTATPVTSPSVGVFRCRPSAGAAPFVEVGARVEPGGILGVVEVMPLTYDITAPCAGVVAEVLVEDSGAVQFGDVLFTLSPETA